MKNPLHLRPDRSDQSVILVADDDVMVLNIVRITLEREGYFVLTAENGEEALVLSRSYPGEIHLFLTDVCMPKMSGIQAAKRIAKERPGICVLLVSGTFDEDNPGFPLLSKPFGITQLSDTIRGLLPACQKARQRA
jgi:two-component system, cell cycle sensor histidine kinase and response regulator CckA